MKVLTVRNVHEALPRGLQLLMRDGEKRDSRNGPVLVAPYPVTTVYEKPCERVIFWPDRDANPFFHLYEALWMLAGRHDVKPLIRYAKNMENYADDGIIHGAYGYRWRTHFDVDQLPIIAKRLKDSPLDRQCVLSMWDTNTDFNQSFKDIPCNTIATFQRDSEGRLDLTVFCRSNDIIWGAYGANAVHFSMLLEYMANWISCPVGVYRQVSVNWHAYTRTLETVRYLPKVIDEHDHVQNRYGAHVCSLPILGEQEVVDSFIRRILIAADLEEMCKLPPPTYAWAYNFWIVLQAHEIYRVGKDHVLALDILSRGDQECDWIVAAIEWMQRRMKKGVFASCPEWVNPASVDGQ